jgi:hypothetical protein
MAQNAKNPLPGASGSGPSNEQAGQGARAFHSAEPAEGQAKSACDAESRDAAARVLSDGRRA